MKRTYLLTAILCFAYLTIHAALPLPELNSRVIDETGTLSGYQLEQLENKLKRLEDSTGSQIVVVMIPTTGDESIEDYSIRLAEQWKIGRKGIDDGIILLVAKNDRKLRIEVGYGFEGSLPDALAARIIDEIITPDFRNGDFAAGINAGTDALIRIAYGEDFALPPPRKSSGTDVSDVLALLIFLISAVVSVVLIVKFRFKAILSLSGIAFLAMLIFAGVAAALGAFFMVLIFSSMILGLFTGGGSSGYSSGSSYSSSSSSWSSGSSGYSGSSFSGGGGSFGGGGASGSW
jgi:uncharacterized protein